MTEKMYSLMIDVLAFNLVTILVYDFSYNNLFSL